MTNQIQGEMLFTGWAGGATAENWAYGPWMPVSGDEATFGVEVVLISSGVTLTWEVQTRTTEAPSPTPTVATNSVSGGVPAISRAASTVALQELYRYRFSTGGTASLSDRVIFRSLMPSWQVDRGRG